jgi:hypothetical protein
LISGLQLPNFIFNCVKFFAELPAFGCKICLVKGISNMKNFFLPDKALFAGVMGLNTAKKGTTVG